MIGGGASMSSAGGKYSAFSHRGRRRNGWQSTLQRQSLGASTVRVAVRQLDEGNEQHHATCVKVADAAGSDSFAAFPRKLCQGVQELLCEHRKFVMGTHPAFGRFFDVVAFCRAQSHRPPDPPSNVH